MAEQTKGAKIRGFSRENERGQAFYEADSMLDARQRAFWWINGTVVEDEEQVPIESVARAVRDGLQAKAGSGKLVNGLQPSGCSCWYFVTRIGCSYRSCKRRSRQSEFPCSICD